MNIKDIETKLWNAANQLRGNMSAEEYMHIILGILCLKYISDKFDKSKKVLEEKGLNIDMVTESEFFSGYNAFKVSEKAHWNRIMKYSQSNEIGLIMDESFVELEKENKMLRGLFNKNYNREGIDQNKLGEVIKIFSDSDFTNAQEDIIGRIYEYFLGKFFKDRGQKGGEFYTPKTIVKLIVHLIKPLEGSIYDPCCGTGGMLVQAKRYIKEHDANIDNVVVYGQEYNNITWKLAKLNLILNGFSLENTKNRGVLGEKSANTFTNDQHANEKFDFIIANPPFNMKNWGREQLKDDPRWIFGLPPKNNANYAWLSHIVSKLSIKGKAGIVLANGSLSGSGKEEIAIRKEMVEQNKVDAIITLPDKLFYTTGIPASIWIFNNDKKTNKILMLDGSQLEGKMISKKLRELTKEEILKFDQEYSKHLDGKDVEKIGFAKTIDKKELEENDYSFVPGRYVGFEEEKIDKKEIKKEIEKSAKELKELFKEIEELTPKIEEAIDKAIKFKDEN